MVNEDYVSFEVAKLLKEKGFDETCFMSYWLRTKDKLELAHLEQTSNNYSDCVSCPTQQMAMKWLREVHNIFIDIRRSLNTYFYGAIIRIDPSDKFYKITEQFETYEEAVEAALKYSLENLI